MNRRIFVESITGFLSGIGLGFGEPFIEKIFGVRKEIKAEKKKQNFDERIFPDSLETKEEKHRVHAWCYHGHYDGYSAKLPIKLKITKGKQYINKDSFMLYTPLRIEVHLSEFGQYDGKGYSKDLSPMVNDNLATEIGLIIKKHLKEFCNEVNPTKMAAYERKVVFNNEGSWSNCDNYNCPICEEQKKRGKI